MRGTVLHVGCGSDPLPDWFDGYYETRLDINPAVSPHICAPMWDVGNIGQFDVVFCRHALEHCAPADVARSLSEFRRVLMDNGHLVVFVPDLQDVTPDDKPLMDTPSGWVTGHDLFYGLGWALDENPHMAHRSAFVPSTLEAALLRAGFSQAVGQRLGNLALMGAARK